jgi:hypothetical protein
MSLPLQVATPPVSKGTAMRTETAIDRVKCDLYRVLDAMRADFDRIEILMAGLSAFSRPIPDYEPNFQHTRHLTLNVHELS